MNSGNNTPDLEVVREDKGAQRVRKHYLDNIRWMTVVLVVIYHVFYMYNAEGVLGGLGKISNLDVQYYDIYQYIVYPWFMPILFLVSGISSRLYLEKHTNKEFIKSRTLKLLVPSTIGLLVFQFIQGYVSMGLSGAFDTLNAVPKPVLYFIMALSGLGVLWYIQLLWVLSLILVLVRKIEKDRLLKLGAKANIIALVLMVIPVWGAAQILNTPVITVYRFGLYGLVFLLGYYVFSHDEVIEVLKKMFIPLLIITLVLCAAFCVSYFGDNFADKPVNRTILYVAFCWFACLTIPGGMAKYGDFDNEFSRWMNKRSFGLYVFHYLGISSVALFVAKPSLLPVPAVYLLSLVAGFVVGYGLNAIISRIPFFRWAVLGIKVRK
ncbi:MAG: acyltransferase [Lachnospiraceae bacterium]|nr:acyltransferase [Lachnospiraceae bacterium]MBR1599917.1 acyltransferase [Lachnospiraceae bacterium]